jgi:hypothetical protein
MSKGRRFADSRLNPLKSLDSRTENLLISLPRIWIFLPSEFDSPSLSFRNSSARSSPRSVAITGINGKAW